MSLTPTRGFRERGEEARLFFVSDSFIWRGGSPMEPYKGEKKVRLELERLEDRLAPSHVRLPLPPPDPPGVFVAAEANPHFGGFSATGMIKFNEFTIK